ASKKQARELKNQLSTVQNEETTWNEKLQVLSAQYESYKEKARGKVKQLKEQLVAQQESGSPSETVSGLQNKLEISQNEGLEKSIRIRSLEEQIRNLQARNPSSTSTQTHSSTPHGQTTQTTPRGGTPSFLTSKGMGATLGAAPVAAELNLAKQRLKQYKLGSAIPNASTTGGKSGSRSPAKEGRKAPATSSREKSSRSSKGGKPWTNSKGSPFKESEDKRRAHSSDESSSSNDDSDDDEEPRRTRRRKPSRDPDDSSS
ncbi:hypothetical protein EV360DRAFT_91090, partial [Lentinula raphanica]